MGRGIHSDSGAEYLRILPCEQGLSRTAFIRDLLFLVKAQLLSDIHGLYFSQYWPSFFIVSLEFNLYILLICMNCGWLCSHKQYRLLDCTVHFVRPVCIGIDLQN